MAEEARMLAAGGPTSSDVRVFGNPTAEAGDVAGEGRGGAVRIEMPAAKARGRAFWSFWTGLGTGVLVSLAGLLIAAAAYETTHATHNKNTTAKTTDAPQAEAARCAFEPDLQAAFLVVGDTGRRGTHNQSQVGDAMAACAATLRPAFVIHTGDIFYPAGLRRPGSAGDQDDFRLSFMEPYKHDALQVPWWTVLGNHDYGDGCGDDVKGEIKASKCPSGGVGRSPRWTLDPALRRRDRRFYCERNYERRLAPDVHFFFIDTNVFIREYAGSAWGEPDVVPGGLRDPDTPQPAYVVSWLTEKLEASDARWKIVVGHHPLYSNGHHGDFPELQDAIQNLLIQHNVAFWLNGHDHDLQHFAVDRSSGALVGSPTAAYYDRSGASRLIHFFTSGAGSKTGRGFPHTGLSVWQSDMPGFMVVKVRDDDASIIAYDLDGKQLYVHTMRRPMV